MHDKKSAQLSKLDELQAGLSTIIELSDDAIISKSLDGIIASWNKSAERIFGYTADEVIGKSITIIFPSDRLDEESEILAKICRGERIDHLETVRKCKDGKLIDVSITVLPIKDSLGRILGAAKIARDITERKKLDNIQFRLAAIVESSDDAIVSKTLEGIITSWNKGAERIFGYTADEVIGKSISILIPSDRHDEEPGILERLKKGERIDHYETIRITKDGKLRDISLTVSPIKDQSGRIIGASKIARDITERKRIEKEIREHREWLRITLSSIGDAVIATDNKGKVTFINPIAESLTGWKQEDAIGKSLIEVFKIVNEKTREVVENPVEKVLDKGIIVGLANHTILISKQGVDIAIDDSGAPIKDDAGNIIGVILVFRDVTEKKRGEQKLNQLLIREQEARKQAEEANRIKDEFLATVSHELRTPLTSILGWIRMIRSDKLDAVAVSKALETIERNARSQAQLVQDLLDISRIISGKLRLEMQPVDLEAVIKSAVDSIRPTADTKSIKLRTIIDSTSPVYGDYERLQQVIWNLLSNAIKFTPKEGKVEIQLERADSNIQITVTDTGEGIKPELLPHIFNRFTQADSSISRTHGGLGLGLSIVKQLVELHGGVITVASEGPGCGSTFTVSLPIMPIKYRVVAAETTDSNIRYKTSSRTDNELAGQKILVIDDEPDTVALLKTIFEEFGGEVKTATSAAKALEILDTWLPTVLISDIGMPGQSGFDLIRQIREHGSEQGRNIPAIALTAFARVEDRMKVLSAGFQMHVPKPIEPDELVTIVASLTKIVNK
ncbi:MAG: PAS domain S-box protein [Acidobacteriota bacterium]